MLALFDFPHAITAASIFSFILYSSPKTWISNPLSMIFGTVLGGTISGSIINRISPKTFRPHITLGIIGISLIGFCAKLLGFSKSRSIKSFIRISISETNSALNRISYTVHKCLHNVGPTLMVNDNLTCDNIINTLIENKLLLDFRVNQALDVIEDVLERVENLDRMSSIFIHGAYQGYVMITSSNDALAQTVSIRI